MIKANGIFKGVNLSTDEGVVNLYFDTLPYFLRVYISILAWCLFFIGLIFSLKYKWEFPIFEKSILQRRSRP
jgi:hypothetical protein